MPDVSFEDIFAKVKQILIDDFEVPEENISLDANLIEELDLDSIDAVDLAVRLQEYTGKKVSPQEFKKIRTIRDVVQAVQNLLKG